MEKARAEDRYGDVDTEKSKEIYWWWLAMTRPEPLPNGFPRPEVFERVYRPDREMFFVEE